MIINFLGPGGVGKSSIIDSLLKSNDFNFLKPISYTSRPPRKGEVDGIDYHFKKKRGDTKYGKSNSPS